MSLRGEIREIIEREPPATRMLELARLYARQGWHVFPVARNGKLPAIPKAEGGHGFLDASIKADDIEAWWGEHPEWNIGIACGPSGLVVVDPDTYKDGVPERWAELSAERGLLQTFTVETPRGGSHYYLRRNGTDFASTEVVPGVDCKSHGGYVLAPGSVIDGKPYVPLTDEGVADVPPSWAKRLPVKNGDSGSRSESRHAYTRDYFFAQANDGVTPVEAATRVLESSAARSMLREQPERARELVLSAVGAYEKIKFASTADAAPPWEHYDADSRFAKEDELALALMGHGTEESARRPLEALDFREIIEAEAEPIPYIVDGWLAEGETGIVGGYGGAGKSTLLLDLAFGLASGTTFAGLDISGGPRRVVYLDEENPKQLLKSRIKRMAAARQWSTQDVLDMPFTYLCKQGVNFDDAGRLDDVSRFCEEHETEFLILDSLCRFHRRDENDNSAMARFFEETFSVLRHRHGLEIIGSHHLSKQSGLIKRSLQHLLRGATEINNYPDVVWGFSYDDKGNRFLHHCKTRWIEQEDMAIRQDETEDELSLVATAPDLAAKPTLSRALDIAGEAGALREDLVSALNGKVKDPGKAVTRTLGPWFHQGKVAKRMEGRNARYWWRHLAPEGAETATWDKRGT